MTLLATFKHISSKNADYGAAEAYLTFEHDEFTMKANRTFQMGSIFGSMSYLAITASDLSDRMLADFLDMESTQIVTMHIQSVDQLCLKSSSLSICKII